MKQILLALAISAGAMSAFAANPATGVTADASSLAGTSGTSIKHAVEAQAAPATAAGDIVARGAYLARASDCIACHTASGGKPFGGGYPIATPFGKIYGTNISSDKQYGIGGWTDDQFVAALREGVGRHGENLYPAMPYDSFTKMSRADVLAIKAYLMSQPAVHVPTPANEMSFPFNQRWALTFWKWFNFKSGELHDDAAHDATWNRGRYMVQALAHCEACHTPRNLMMGMDEKQMLGGGDVGNWTAFNLTSDPHAGLGGWSDAEIVQYLKHGVAHGRGVAAGPMGEAVENSLQYLHDDDLHAIVTYLRTVPAIPNDSNGASRSQRGTPATQYAMLRGAPSSVLLKHQGAELYLAQCASCHAVTGQGIGKGDKAYPSLMHDSAVGAAGTKNLISVILGGVNRKMASGDVSMPAFGDKLSDAEVASLATYLKQQFGERSVTITAKDVAKLRPVASTH